MIPSNPVTHNFGNSLLVEFNWGEFDLHKADIIEYCLNLEKPNTVESNIAVSAKHNLWESKFNFLESNSPGVIALKLWLVQECEKYVSTINNKNYKFVITESWAHVTREGGYHLPHYHSGSTWSGIFYIGCDGTTGKNCWQVPYNLERKPGLDFINDRFSFIPTLGKLIMFPSMITHYAESYFGKSPRIVVAFNAVCIQHG